MKIIIYFSDLILGEDNIENYIKNPNFNNN